MLGIKFNSECGVNREDIWAFWLFVSRVIEGIVVTWENVVLDNSCGIRLHNSLLTSGFHHLSPNLGWVATLSVVGTCWAAKGLIGAMARLNAAVSANGYINKEWLLKACDWHMDKVFVHRCHRVAILYKLQELGLSGPRLTLIKIYDLLNKHQLNFSSFL